MAGINLVDAVTSFAPGLLSLVSAELGTAWHRRILPSAATPFARMLAYNGMVPRAVQQDVTGITTDGLDRAFAAVPRMLLSHGARDALFVVAMSRRMLAINRSARFSIYANAGHAPFIKDASRFNREIAAFAASLPAGDLP